LPAWILPLDIQYRISRRHLRGDYFASPSQATR